ncbi:MAG: hypothetical protein WC686_01490 [Candidatus Shapirobacteria bacterium]|jgi:hypothetical protein
MLETEIKQKEIGTVNFEKSESVGNYVVVPNVSAIAREMTGTSQIMIIVKKFLALGWISKITLMVNNMPFVFKLLKMDYATGVKVLCELEILRCKEKSKRSKLFILHSQMVDMALALNNRKVMDNFFWLASRYKFAPGLMTKNLGFFIKFMSLAKQLPMDLVVVSDLKNQNMALSEYLKISQIKFLNICE